MKHTIHYFTLLALTITIYGCEQRSLQKQLDEKFGKYIEDIQPENRAFYKAYDNALKLWDTPYGEVNIKTSFGNAHVIVSGPENGEALVLLHGMNASSTMWYPNVKALSENYRVYAIDYLLEPGKSQQKGKIKNMDEVMSWYNEIITQLKLEEFSLIGASRGGWMAIYIALQHQHQIKSMILLSPAQTFTSIQPNSDILTNIVYSINPEREDLREVLATMSVNVDNIKQAYIDLYFIASEKASISKLILQMTPYSDDELQSLSMPVLTLIGDSDIINNQKSLDKAIELLPYTVAAIIENAGHFLSVDQAEIVNTKMLDFLNAQADVNE